MGCAASKNTVSVTPAAPEASRARGEPKTNHPRPSAVRGHVLAEQVAAGWPAWLSAVVPEATQGWLPLKSDSFQMLEKIGQGTYSSVFRARDLNTGKIVALKKVKLESLEPDCIKFMAREIVLLRRLDHPNIIKLNGFITSQLSCYIYLVFEYMEHDLAGLSSCPDITLSEPQVKCYMHQLLSGLDHCHSRGIMHRDIKSSNLLVSNDGVLKIADFGLANSFSTKHKKLLTSRVVTLWYRPPELILGSSYYGPSVDLWSVGCVFAELLLGKPILQGQTEVEQLHKIFKLCGSPPEDYWSKIRSRHTTVFRPQQTYKSTLRETCKGLSPSAIDLIEVLLSVEPNKRGTPSSALRSKYFATPPYACDPSSLPKYRPCKEIDAKSRAEHRQRVLSRARSSEATRRLSRTHRPHREENGLRRLVTHVEGSHLAHRRTESNSTQTPEELHTNPEMMHLRRDAMLISGNSPGDTPSSELVQVPSSSGFAWARKRSEFLRRSRLDSKSETGSELDTKDQEDGSQHDTEARSRGNAPHGTRKYRIQTRWSQLQHQDSFDSCKELHSEDCFDRNFMKDGTPSSISTLSFRDSREMVDFSGPLFSQSLKVDEMLQRHERHIRQAIQRRTWLQKVLMQGK